MLEFDFPARLPWANENLRKAWESKIPVLRERLRLLNEAFTLSGGVVRIEQFAKGCEFLFKANQLDTMTAEQIAAQASWLGSRLNCRPQLEYQGAVPILDTRFATNEDWQLLRCHSIGGSEPATLMGLSPYRGGQENWLDKMNGPTNVISPDTQFIFDVGHAVEDVCIKRFCSVSGAIRIDEPRMFRSKKWPELTANVDGILQMPNGNLAIFEAKTANPRKRQEWLEGPPAYYITQCRHYLAVLDDPRIEGVYIGCVFNNSPSDCVFHFIERDEVAEQQQCQYVVDWWKTYILGGKMPPLAGKPAIDRNVIQQQELDPDAEIEAPQLQALCARYLEAEEYRAQKYEELKEATDYRDEVAFTIQQRMGAAAKAKVGPYTAVRKQKKGRITVDANKLARQFPDAYKACAQRGREHKEFSVLTPKD